MAIANGAGLRQREQPTKLGNTIRTRVWSKKRGGYENIGLRTPKKGELITGCVDDRESTSRIVVGFPEFTKKHMNDEFETEGVITREKREQDSIKSVPFSLSGVRIHPRIALRRKGFEELNPLIS